MKLYQKVLAILTIIISLHHHVQASTCDSISLNLMEQTWREFRAIHPFGFQTVGLKHKGDTCIFVISEPAEWVRKEDLVALFTKYDGHLIECIQPYGYDGELHDFVGCLRRDKINSQLFRSELFNLLYFTDYKAYYTDFDHPAKHTYFSNKDINFIIDSRILRLSLFNESFNVPTKKNLSFDSLMKSKTSSNNLYFSKERGFVIWVLNSIGVSRTDSVFLKTARKFALDTDLILGSIYENGKVAIIGREREVSVNILPPLRSETIRQLLGCYARPLDPLPMRMMSMIDDPNDFTFNNYPWLIFNSLETDSVQPDIYSVQPDIYYAPVSMSNNVCNTELANLMYLTDVILKSWCENGKVKDKFINYPFPKSFPYPNGVTHELGDSLRVYWRMFDSMFDILSIYYTGCCFPKISSFTKRDSIQNDKDIQVSCNLDSYFAEQQCVDLVRIKQYSILLNAFRYLRVGQSKRQGTSRQKTPSITVSNKKWLYGGYLPLLQVGPQALKGMARGLGRAAAESAVRRTVAGSAARRTASESATRHTTQRVALPGAQRDVPGGAPALRAAQRAVPGGAPALRAAKNEYLLTESFRLRKELIHPQRNGTERGFDPKTHNTPSPDLLLSDSEKQEHLDKSDREKKMMEDLRLRLQQFNIPVKVIQNEQRIIIHAINILKNYDTGFEFEWAA